MDFITRGLILYYLVFLLSFLISLEFLVNRISALHNQFFSTIFARWDCFFFPFSDLIEELQPLVREAIDKVKLL